MSRYIQSGEQELKSLYIESCVKQERNMREGVREKERGGEEERGCERERERGGGVERV